MNYIKTLYILFVLSHTVTDLSSQTEVGLVKQEVVFPIEADHYFKTQLDSGRLDSTLLINWLKIKTKESPKRYEAMMWYDDLWFGKGRPTATDSIIDLQFSFFDRAKSLDSIIGVNFWNEYYWQDSRVNVNCVGLSYYNNSYDDSGTLRGIQGSDYFVNNKPLDLMQCEYSSVYAWKSSIFFNDTISGQSNFEVLKSFYNESFTEMLVKKIKEGKLKAFDPKNGEALSYDDIKSMHQLHIEDLVVGYAATITTENPETYYNKIYVLEKYMISKENKIEVEVKSIRVQVFNGEKYDKEFIVYF